MPLLVLGLMVSAVVEPDHFWDKVVGAALGYLGFVGLAAVYRAIRSRDGLGRGDAKLLAVAGAWNGLAAIPDVVLLAAVLAIAITTGSIAVGKSINPNTRVPFGPYLSIAIWVLHLHGAEF